MFAVALIQSCCFSGTTSSRKEEAWDWTGRNVQSITDLLERTKKCYLSKWSLCVFNTTSVKIPWKQLNCSACHLVSPWPSLGSSGKGTGNLLKTTHCDFLKKSFQKLDIEEKSWVLKKKLNTNTADLPFTVTIGGLQHNKKIIKNN